MKKNKLIRTASLFIYSCLYLLAANTHSQTLKYTYDELGRLTFVEDDKNGNRDYKYDAAGNRVMVDVYSNLAPSISPNGGTFPPGQAISLSFETSDATIRYTTNGSNVTSSSPIYSAPFMLNANTIVKARAFKTGMIDSGQTSAGFIIQLPAPTGFSSIPKSMTGTTGMYESTWNPVTGATYYILRTVEGIESNLNQTMYIHSAIGQWVKACNTNGCSLASGPPSAQPVGTPSISPAGGSFTSEQTVSISILPSDATIRFTTNGSDVTASSPIYSAPFKLISNTTVKTKGFKSHMLESPQASASFTINIPQLPAPTGLSSLPKSFTGTSDLYESKWNLVEGATHYILRTIGGVESSVNYTPYIHATKGHWVKACNAAGCSQVSLF